MLFHRMSRHGCRFVHRGFDRGFDREPQAGHGPGGHRRHHGRGGRLFDYGELRLVLLALIAERPRHGYELIKAIEDRAGGAYSPSPGVIYPTLTQLEDLGLASVEAAEGGRKLYAATEAGRAHLAANDGAVRAALARIERAGPVDADAAPIVRARENLKLALRLRLSRGTLDPAAIDAIAAALDAAAAAIERA